tara:strand:+ start:6565 stop:7320 length:756 start_codon:yes stop_codon:yes gene_type:complete
LFKKSFLHKSFEEIEFNYLWENKGVFTTMRFIKSTHKILFLKEHINRINNSLNSLGINFQLDEFYINKLISFIDLDNSSHDLLIRVAINKNIVSISTRKFLESNKKFTCYFKEYKRENPEIKNLKYIKILDFLKTINNVNEEVLLSENNIIFEGCTTNIILNKNKNIYIPKNNYYRGTTMMFILNKLEELVIEDDILISDINKYDEILLVGTGKGVVSVEKIENTLWENKSDFLYKKLSKIYYSKINKLNL